MCVCVCVCVCVYDHFKGNNMEPMYKSSSKLSFNRGKSL